jgi:hypothetical protein
LDPEKLRVAVDMFDELDRLDSEEAPDTDRSAEKTDDIGVASRSGDEVLEVWSIVLWATSSPSDAMLERPKLNFALAEL